MCEPKKIKCIGFPIMSVLRTLTSPGTISQGTVLQLSPEVIEGVRAC